MSQVLSQARSLERSTTRLRRAAEQQCQREPHRGYRGRDERRRALKSLVRLEREAARFYAQVERSPIEPANFGRLQNRYRKALQQRPVLGTRGGLRRHFQDVRVDIDQLSLALSGSYQTARRVPELARAIQVSTDDLGRCWERDLHHHRYITPQERAISRELRALSTAAGVLARMRSSWVTRHDARRVVARHASLQTRLTRIAPNPSLRRGMARLDRLVGNLSASTGQLSVRTRARTVRYRPVAPPPPVRFNGSASWNHSVSFHPH